MIDLILTGLGNTGLALADHIARTKEIGSVVLAADIAMRLRLSTRVHMRPHRPLFSIL